MMGFKSQTKKKKKDTEDHEIIGYDVIIYHLLYKKTFHYVCSYTSFFSSLQLIGASYYHGTKFLFTTVNLCIAYVDAETKLSVGCPSESIRV
jgi:hypothetical protein